MLCEGDDVLAVLPGDRHPDAGFHVKIDALHLERRLQGVQERDGDAGRGFDPLHVQEQDGELVPAQAGKGVHPAEGLGEARPDLAE
jgi:hypothetical protein